MIPLDRVSERQIAEAWPGGDKYRIDGSLVRQNLLDSPLLDRVASVWDDGAFVAIKRSAAGLYEGPDRKTVHLSLFTTKGTDVLLAHALESLRADGVETVVVGTDNGHFLPGAPEDLPELGRWLGSCGFVGGGLAHDLERDLDGYVLPSGLPNVGDFLPFRAETILLLDTFLAREFPGRWRFDVMQKVEFEGPQTTFGLFIEGQCEGFALIQNEGCRRPIGGAVWKANLGPSWGSLGPIGISKSIRGRGLGRALLAHALTELRARGARRTIIDWTGLVDFYGAEGFTVARTYRSYRLDLAAGRSPSA